MWDEYGIYILLALGAIAFFLSLQFWSNAFYVMTKNWRLVAFTVILGTAGMVGVLKLQDFKYHLAFNYYLNLRNSDIREARYQVRQCKEFVEAEMKGEDIAEFRTISFGFIPVSNISNWEVCARTFAMNQWKEDISIDGQDGGRLLCQAYARKTYRSAKVNTWCDTVFAPATTPPQDVGT